MNLDKAIQYIIHYNTIYIIYIWLYIYMSDEFNDIF